VALVCLSVAELPGTFVHRLHNRVTDQDRRHRRISTTQTLCDSLDIGDNILLFPGMQGPTTAHAAHNLVKDQESTVLLANSFHCTEVPWYCGDTTKSLMSIS